ncbi:MAG: hypothetical protein ACI4RI_04595 [Ruminococcus sp.]
MNKLPNIFLTILGSILLAIALFIISVAYWIATNLITILVVVGCVVIATYFIATVYSYCNGVKSIKANFYLEEQERLLISLRRKTMSSAIKAIIFMLIYAGLWGIVIYFVNDKLL